MNTPDNVRQHAGAFVAAAGHLIEAITSQMPEDKQRRIVQLVSGGGRIGLEVLVDAQGAPSIAVIAVGANGKRLTLATMTPNTQERPRYVC